MISTKDVLDRYICSFSAGDLEGLLSCYAPDAVLFSPHGVAKGTKAIRMFLRTILAAFRGLGMSFELEQQSIEQDFGYVRWSANAVVKFGYFTVRSGKIVSQSLTVRIASDGGYNELLAEAAEARSTATTLRPSGAACDLHAYASALELAAVHYPVPAVQRLERNDA